MIYLDYNATTPCDEEVLAAMLPYFNTKYGNASSKTHLYGWTADEGVKIARKEVAEVINADESEVIFVSGATEGCNLAIKGVFESYITKGKHIITCLTEHKAVLDTCAYLEKKGAEVTYLPVNEDGLINLNDLEQAIRKDTVLIALMYANNETGVIQPIMEIGNISKKNNVIFFCDATQAIGKVNVDVQRDGIDILTLSAHKIYGPKGVGALYVRRKNPRVRLAAQINGGGHEKGLRSGTLNVPGIVGLGKACKKVVQEMKEEKILDLKKNRDLLESELLKWNNTIINGHKDKRLPNVCNISFCGIKAERLVTMLSTEVAFSIGSACTSAHQLPSHVLKAMNLSEERINGAVRLSLGRMTNETVIKQVCKKLQDALKELNKEQQIHI